MMLGAPWPPEGPSTPAPPRREHMARITADWVAGSGLAHALFEMSSKNTKHEYKRVFK